MAQRKERIDRRKESRDEDDKGKERKEEPRKRGWRNGSGRGEGRL